MRQSNAIFGAIAIAWIVYITVRGSLPVYLSVLFGTVDMTAPEAKPGDGTAAGAMAVTIDDLSKGAPLF